MKSAVVLFVVAHCLVEHAVGLVHPKYRCYGRPNEKYTNSYDSRCDSYCNVPDTLCPAVFTNVDGCYCNEGYFRNSEGVCVESWKCGPFPQPPFSSPVPSPFLFPPSTPSIDFCLQYPQFCYDPLTSIPVPPVPVWPEYGQWLPAPVYPPVAYQPQPIRQLIRRNSALDEIKNHKN